MIGYEGLCEQERMKKRNQPPKKGVPDISDDDDDGTGVYIFCDLPTWLISNHL